MSLTKNMFQHVQGFRDKEVFVLLLKPLPFSYQNRMVQQMCCIFSKASSCILPFLPLYYFNAEFQNRITAVSIISPKSADTPIFSKSA